MYVPLHNYQNHSEDLEFSQYKLNCEKHTHQVHKTLERGAKYWSLFSSSGNNAKPKAKVHI